VTLSFLELVKNSPKMRFWICRAAVAPSDAAGKKLQYRCTTTIHHVHRSPKHLSENLLPVWLCVWQASSFRAFFGLPIRNLTLAVSAM